MEECYDAFVGFHRYSKVHFLCLKDTSVTAIFPCCRHLDHTFSKVHSSSYRRLYFDADQRAHLRDETVQFMSTIAALIQELTGDMDEASAKLNTTRLRFHQLIISDLMQVSANILPCPSQLLTFVCYLWNERNDQKLNAISKIWDAMQKEQQRISTKPSRLFAHIYAEDHTKGASQLDGDKTPMSSVKAKSTASASPAITASSQSETEGFAQRYIDEIAPRAKMQMYEHIANQQRKALFKETQALQQRFSEDMAVSMQVERTVMAVSKMVTEFAGLLEGQSGAVESIGDVAKDVKEAMKVADQELLVTLERTQSQSWNTIVLTITLSLVMLVFHFITP